MMMKLATTLILISILGAASVVLGEDQKSGTQVNDAVLALQRRAYPGGRDESDLTVQPHKRISKKQDNSEAGFEAEPEITSSGADEGFGE